MSLANDVCTAVAQLLADEEVAEWNPSGVYGPNDVAIFVAIQPPKPTAVVTLSLYALQDDGNDQGDSTWGLQVRMRHGQDPRMVQDLQAQVFGALHDRTALPYGEQQPGTVLLVRRSYSAPLNPDDENRWTVADTYQLWLTRPEEQE